MKLHFSKDNELPDQKMTDGLASPADISTSHDAPDLRIWAEEKGITYGHLALWWQGTPPYESLAVGTIGAFAAENEEVAAALVMEACEQLKKVGCGIAIGPMNRNTWMKHRHVIFSDGRSPFFLEPRNFAFEPSWWDVAGFQKLATYTSSIVTLGGEASVSERLEARLVRSGVVIRQIRMEDYTEELRAIHEVCLKSFSQNFLYTNLERELFLSAYNKLRDHVNPELVMLAERDGEVCGFVFAIADLEEMERGGRPALIIKTLAVDPDSRCPGLGSLLVDKVQQAGVRLGFTEAIHALQYEDNSARKITGRHDGHVFRRYALFSRLL